MLAHSSTQAVPLRLATAAAVLPLTTPCNTRPHYINGPNGERTLYILCSGWSRGKPSRALERHCMSGARLEIHILCSGWSQP